MPYFITRRNGNTSLNGDHFDREELRCIVVFCSTSIRRQASDNDVYLPCAKFAISVVNARARGLYHVIIVFAGFTRKIDYGSYFIDID